MSALHTEVKGCQRCGGEHPALAFAPLSHPTDDYRYWALCPATGEPILFRVSTLVRIGHGRVG